MAAPHWTDDGAIDAWLTWMRSSRGRSELTVNKYEAALARLREFLDGKALLDANSSELEMFCGLWLHKKGVVARSRIPYVSAVRGFYKWARKEGAVKVNPATGLEHPKTGNPLPRAISLANAEKLMWAPDMGSFIGVRDALMLTLLIGCGLRVSGLVGMNESDVRSLEIEGQLRLTVSVTEKGSKQRRIPLPMEADRLLRVYLDHDELKAIDRSIEPKPGKSDKVLFVSVRSTVFRPGLSPGEQRRLTRKAVNDMIHRYGKKVGIPKEELHPHAMRHLFGTELTEDNVPTASVAELLGHADLKSTAIYIQLAMKRKAGLLDKHGPMSKMNTPVSELLKRLPK